jgi:hypothetical protein
MSICTGQADYKMVYMQLAIYTRIVGLQNGPKEDGIKKRPLRLAIIESLNHFSERHPNTQLPGYSVFEAL